MSNKHKRRMFIIKEIVSRQETEAYAISLDDTDEVWMLMRRSVDPKTGHSPLVGTATSLPEAFEQLGNILDQ
jgi:hypothetical protein